jgi:hypothetical protein
MATTDKGPITELLDKLVNSNVAIGFESMKIIGELRAEAARHERIAVDKDYWFARYQEKDDALGKLTAEHQSTCVTKAYSDGQTQAMTACVQLLFGNDVIRERFQHTVPISTQQPPMFPRDKPEPPF